MLALGDALENDANIFVEGFLGQGNDGATLHQRFSVCLVNKLGQVFVFLQSATAFASADIAYERPFQQISAGTRIFHVGEDDLNVLLDFLGNGRRVFAYAFGGTFEGYAVEQAVLDLNSIFEGEMLVGVGIL